ncbi:formimidoylglutamase [Thorsellia kenyensis]|uniref:Formimidoylglutamase n=1 Tax=Thorsellia kenyensis TaxID=1549888 RepID=A0ABV6CAN6_9GAMM
MTFNWTGRSDGDGILHRRWHNIVKTRELNQLQLITQNEEDSSSHLSNRKVKSKMALLGLRTDEGVNRNQGRLGAVEGPLLIRKKLANIAVHDDYCITDFGDHICETNQLEHFQEEQIKIVTNLLLKKYHPILLGGGHEIAFGNALGLAGYLIKDINSNSGNQMDAKKSSLSYTSPDRNMYENDDFFQRCQNILQGNLEPISQQFSEIKIGIINIDAHFDLREDDRSTSGTPFLQIASVFQALGIPFHYCCLGINVNSNTAKLFETAKQLAVTVIKDEELSPNSFLDRKDLLVDFIKNVDHIYLSIDLDVFSSMQAPGVSAPSAKGISLEMVEILLSLIYQSKKVRLVDIAELNPHYDIDDRTAQLAAYLVTQLTKLQHIYQQK